MKNRNLSEEQILFLQQTISNNINQIDYLMQETARAISKLTNYTAIVKETKINRVKIKHVQLISLDDSSLLLVTVKDSLVVKNNIIKTHKAYSMDKLYALSNILNVYLANLSLDQLNETLISSLTADFKEDYELIPDIILAVGDALKNEDKSQVYMSGAKNILEFPEFSNIEKAKAIFQTLEKKELLITLLSHIFDDDIQIMIGSENDIDEMKNCSVIRAKYTLGNNSYGSIAIIGPTRMDYPQVVSVLNGLIKNIDMVIKALTGG